MDSKFVTVSANDYAVSALELMRNRGLSQLFVLDRDEIAGMIFEKDLKGLSEKLLRNSDVRETMVTNLQVIEPNLPREEAESLLHRDGLACLVVREGRRIQGVITRDRLGHPGKSNRYASRPAVS
ncbi:MAG TPA: CBS domain-containing protein [Coleofasciculaceae cyanobacterium]